MSIVYQTLWYLGGLNQSSAKWSSTQIFRFHRKPWCLHQPPSFEPWLVGWPHVFMGCLIDVSMFIRLSPWCWIISYSFNIGFIPHRLLQDVGLSTIINQQHEKKHRVWQFSGSTLHLEPCFYPEHVQSFHHTLDLPIRGCNHHEDYTPQKWTNSSPKKGLVGNTSEPTIDFQKTFVSFQGSITLLVGNPYKTFICDC